MARRLYTLLLWLLLPWLLCRLWWRGRQEAGYAVAPWQRFGCYAEAESRPLIWLHAVSLGEMRAAEPLLQQLLTTYPGYRLLLSCMTATGREAALQRFAGQAAVRVVWLPYDYPFAVKRFLDTFQPAIGLIMETEIWPNLMQACSARRLPVLLINARLSERSARRYRWLRQLLRPAMQAFSAVSAQSAADAERLQALGASEVELGGNLKFEMPENPLAATIAVRLRQYIGTRPVLLAASTREGEEALILDAMLHVMSKSAADRSPDMTLPGALPLLVIVPRHPTRFDNVEALLRTRGLRWQRRSADQPLAEDCQVLLGDSMGEMAAYFRACDLAFIGGSLLPFGGQNLIEACAAGVPVLLGPHTYNFSQVSVQALQDGAARRVDDASDLWQQALQLLQDPVQRQQMGQAGIRFCAAHQGASGRLMRLIARYLPLSCSPAER